MENVKFNINKDKEQSTCKRQQTNTWGGKLLIDVEFRHVLSARLIKITLDAMLEIFHYLTLFQLLPSSANLP